MKAFESREQDFERLDPVLQSDTSLQFKVRKNRKSTINLYSCRIFHC